MKLCAVLSSGLRVLCVQTAGQSGFNRHSAGMRTGLTNKKGQKYREEETTVT